MTLSFSCPVQQKESQYIVVSLLEQTNPSLIELVCTLSGLKGNNCVVVVSLATEYVTNSGNFLSTEWCWS